MFLNFNKEKQAYLDKKDIHLIRCCIAAYTNIENEWKDNLRNRLNLKYDEISKTEKIHKGENVYNGKKVLIKFNYKELFLISFLFAEYVISSDKYKESEQKIVNQMGKIINYLS